MEGGPTVFPWRLIIIFFFLVLFWCGSVSLWGSPPGHVPSSCAQVIQNPKGTPANSFSLQILEHHLVASAFFWSCSHRWKWHSMRFYWAVAVTFTDFLCLSFNSTFGGKQISWYLIKTLISFLHYLCRLVLWVKLCGMQVPLSIRGKCYSNTHCPQSWDSLFQHKSTDESVLTRDAVSQWGKAVV